MKILKFFLFLGILNLLACQQTTDKPKTEQTTTAAQPTVAKKNILFFGNSLTAAYGLDDVSLGFVSLTQNRIDSLKLPYRCINAGLSGETTAGGAQRVDWVIAQQPVDVFVLELGGNDALRGLKPDESTKNLQTIIDKVKAKYPSVQIILAGMEAPRNMGKDYTTAFHNIYPALATKNKLPLIPFILEGVGGVAELNQKDGIHPTAEGNKIIVETIWKTLKPFISQ
ncbi:MAG: arylesterase [Saprospiraceae bacterium]|nr:arylesterase [Saprospiraceae bacterium]